MFFTVDELDLSTWGIVESTDDCPPIADGEGEVVISRFKTLQAEEMTRITLAEGSVILGTSVHPVWSVDAEDWVPLAELVAGERLQTRSGEIKIASVATFVYRQSVYNFEVHTEHVYEIGQLGVLVHNGGGAGCPIGKAPRGLLDAPMKFRKLSNNALNKTINGDQHVLLRNLFKNEGAAGLTRESLDAAQELSRRAILNTATSPAQKLVHQERLRQILEALGNL
jgi:hypothetical protein